MVVLVRYVSRDAGTKLRWRVVVDDEGVDLVLPAARSLIHRLDSVAERVPFDAIEVVEGRLEAYPSLGIVTMQRCYALRLRSGRRIVLGEDRALGTGFASSLLIRTVEQILRRGQIAAHDLGMVEGRGGILGVLFASTPPWDTPSLDPERQAQLWRAARMTGALAESAAFTPLFGSGSLSPLLGPLIISTKVAQGIQDSREGPPDVEPLEGPEEPPRP